jgi:hypothetical protein
MMDYEGRPAPEEYSSYFAPYVARVPVGGIVGVLERQVGETRALLAGLSEEEAEYAYAPGKWSIKEVVGHLSDSERVFAYRALRFARGDGAELAGFDDKEFVTAGCFGGRTLASLLEEFAAVRAATVSLLAGLPAEAWTRRGVANGQVASVRGLASIIAGHELHHRALLVERYLGALVAPEARGR